MVEFYNPPIRMTRFALLSVYFLLFFSVAPTVQAQFFNQDFRFSNTLADYVNAANPNIRQFNAAASDTRTAVDISGGTLRMRRINNGGGNENMMVVRSTDIVGAPLTSMMIRFSITAFNCDSPGASGQQFGTFQVGSGFGTANSTEPAANTYAEFGINISDTDDQYTLSHNGTVSPTLFTGAQRSTIALNNSGATITYIGPDGNPETVANDRMDIWIGTTRLFDDVAVTTPAQSMTDFKLVLSAGPQLDKSASSRFSASFDDISIFPLTDMPAATYTVGNPTGTGGAAAVDNYQFTSLTRNGGGFFEVLNFRGGIAGPVNFQVMQDISVENGVNALNQLSGMSATNRVEIQPDGTTMRTVSGDVNNGNGMIGLNGADYVVFDGRAPASAGTGSSEPRYLTFRNNSTGGNVFQLRNGAQNNQIKYCNILGASTNNTAGRRGVISFFTSTSVGNNENIIEYNHITQSASRPFVGIASDGSAAAPNSNNIVRFNEIYDFMMNNSTARNGHGIGIFSGSDAWTISQNNFYLPNNQTASSGNTTVNGIIWVNTTECSSNGIGWFY